MRDRGEVPAPEPTDLALDPTLLMRPFDAGQAEERVVAVVRPQSDEPFVLPAGPPEQDPDDRWGQVVVADHPGRHPTQRSERPDVPVQERFLGLVGVGDVHGLARVRQAQHEHPQLHHDPGDHSAELPEVDLRLHPRRVGLGDRDLAAVESDLDLQRGDHRAHARLGHLRSFLLDQSLPHPPGGVALLARRVQIRDQPAADRGLVRAQRGRDPYRRLRRRRHRVREGLAHRAPMHPMPYRERADRQTLITVVTSDTFELLHSRLLLQGLTFHDRLGRRHGQ